MADLLSKTFPTDAEGRALLKKVLQALHNLTGHASLRDGKYLVAPRRLNAERDTLKGNYRAIWAQCTIQYDEEERGASIRGGKEIRIGPFFLEKRFTAMDMEKIILHEFLHAALAITMKEAHHGMIDQVIQFNLKYPGAPNPAEGNI